MQVMIEYFQVKFIAISNILNFRAHKERETERVYVRERNREGVCERERQRECMRERNRESVCERERQRECVWERERKTKSVCV